MKHIDLYETKQHGTKEFPIEIYEVDSAHHQYVMPAHWHNEFEILRIIEGTFILYINNIPLMLNAGDIAFINCKELHRGVPENCKYECIVFDLQLLKDINRDIYISYLEPLSIGTFEISNNPKVRDSEIYGTVQRLFETLKAKKPFFKLRLMSYIYAIFELFYTEELVIENNTSEKLLKQSAIITKLIRWIDDNYTENITLSILASKVGLSHSYLCKIFKEYTGKSPIEYVNSVRIENICIEINEGQKNITAIATNNGYNDISYFCKVFKKHTGISAKKYAKMHSACVKTL